MSKHSSFLKTSWIFVSVWIGGLIISSAAEPNWPVIGFTPVVSGVGNTVDIQNAADGSGRLFLVRQSGKIQILKNGALLASPLLDVSSLELSAAYEDPARAYHNLNHITDCLLRLDEHVHLASDPVAVEFAIWFHDIVYDTHAPDNEERSAIAAAEFLADTSHGDVVSDLIRATRHDSQPGTPDAALLCDIDLSILGRPPAVYDAYARAIRQEYEWVPLPDFIKGRTRVLESFLGRSSVFVLEEMEKIYGEHARANLEREIRDLSIITTD